MPSTVSCRAGGRTLAAELAPLLDDWTAAEPMVAGLHSGDVGWHLRHDDERLAAAFRLWVVDGAPAAVALVEETVVRTAVAPASIGDTLLAEAMADELQGVDYVDAPPGGASRKVLLRSGWAADPDPWILLYKELDARDAAFEDAGTSTLSGATDVEARVAVQRSAFAPGSTFTPELWTRMAAGPSYDARFELLARTPTGAPAAAATGWFAGVGRCAILEPVGTHRDHQRQGYGRRANLAVMSALARAGASAIRVHTPASNVAAVKAYESCGLRQIEWTTDLVSPRAQSALVSPA